MPAERSDEVLRLRETLAEIAPGTALRDGLERILRGRTGALIVLGHDRVVEQISTGGFELDVPFTATGLRELAKMDGGIIIDKDITRIIRAAVHLSPTTPSPPTRPHPAPHRRPGGQAVRLPGDLGVTVDADHRGVRRRDPARPRGLRADPVPGQPGAGHPGRYSCGSTRSPAPSPRSRSRTWSPCATSRWWPSGWRWSLGSRARSRTTCSSSAPRVGCSHCSSRADHRRRSRARTGDPDYLPSGRRIKPERLLARLRHSPRPSW